MGLIEKEKKRFARKCYVRLEKQKHILSQFSEASAYKTKNVFMTGEGFPKTMLKVNVLSVEGYKAHKRTMASTNNLQLQRADPGTKVTGF